MEGNDSRGRSGGAVLPRPAVAGCHDRPVPEPPGRLTAGVRFSPGGRYVAALADEKGWLCDLGRPDGGWRRVCRGAAGLVDLCPSGTGGVWAAVSDPGTRAAERFEYYDTAGNLRRCLDLGLSGPGMWGDDAWLLVQGNIYSDTGRLLWVDAVTGRMTELPPADGTILHAWPGREGRLLLLFSTMMAGGSGLETRAWIPGEDDSPLLDRFPWGRVVAPRIRDFRPGHGTLTAETGAGRVEIDAGGRISFSGRGGGAAARRDAAPEAGADGDRAVHPAVSTPARLDSGQVDHDSRVPRSVTVSPDGRHVLVCGFSWPDMNVPPEDDTAFFRFDTLDPDAGWLPAVSGPVPVAASPTDGGGLWRLDELDEGVRLTLEDPAGAELDRLTRREDLRRVWGNDTWAAAWGSDVLVWLERGPDRVVRELPFAGRALFHVWKHGPCLRLLSFVLDDFEDRRSGPPELFLHQWHPGRARPDLLASCLFDMYWHGHRNNYHLDMVHAWPGDDGGLRVRMAPGEVRVTAGGELVPNDDPVAWMVLRRGRGPGLGVDRLAWLSVMGLGDADACYLGSPDSHSLFLATIETDDAVHLLSTGWTGRMDRDLAPDRGAVAAWFRDAKGLRPLGEYDRRPWLFLLLFAVSGPVLPVPDAVFLSLVRSAIREIRGAAGFLEARADVLAPRIGEAGADMVLDLPQVGREPVSALESVFDDLKDCPGLLRAFVAGFAGKARLGHIYALDSVTKARGLEFPDQPPAPSLAGKLAGLDAAGAEPLLATARPGEVDREAAVVVLGMLGRVAESAWGPDELLCLDTLLAGVADRVGQQGWSREEADLLAGLCDPAAPGRGAVVLRRLVIAGLPVPEGVTLAGAELARLLAAPGTTLERLAGFVRRRVVRDRDIPVGVAGSLLSAPQRYLLVPALLREAVSLAGGGPEMSRDRVADLLARNRRILPRSLRRCWFAALAAAVRAGGKP